MLGCWLLRLQSGLSRPPAAETKKVLDAVWIPRTWRCVGPKGSVVFLVVVIVLAVAVIVVVLFELVALFGLANVHRSS